MLLVPVSSVQYGSIGTFSYRKLYKKTWYSSKISMNFINFSGVIFLNQGVLIPQNRIMSIPPGQNVLILFVNNTYIGNIRTVWHRKLYMKTWYSSKSLWIFSIFLVLTFWAQNVLMPRYSILLIAGSLGGGGGWGIIYTVCPEIYNFNWDCFEYALWILSCIQTLFSKDPTNNKNYKTKHRLTKKFFDNVYIRIEIYLKINFIWPLLKILFM